MCEGRSRWRGMKYGASGLEELMNGQYDGQV